MRSLHVNAVGSAVELAYVFYRTYIDCHFAYEYV